MNSLNVVNIAVNYQPEDEDKPNAVEQVWYDMRDGTTPLWVVAIVKAIEGAAYIFNVNPKYVIVECFAGILEERGTEILPCQKQKRRNNVELFDNTKLTPLNFIQQDEELLAFFNAKLKQAIERLDVDKLAATLQKSVDKYLDDLNLSELNYEVLDHVSDTIKSVVDEIFEGIKIEISTESKPR